MNRAFAPTPPDPNAGGLVRVAKYLAMAGGSRSDAIAIAERSETNVHVLEMTKAAVPSGVTTAPDQEALVNARTLTAAFIPQLRGRSAFYELAGSEALTLVPFEHMFGYTTTDASAFVAGEGAAIPVSRMSLGSEVLKPILAAGVVVLSKELLQAMGVRGESFLNRELRRAVAAAVDTKFFAALLDDDAPQIESTGSDGDAVGLDLRSLLAAV
ncbi:phage major capsid protein, partial [Prosthecomicrobium pneumaticum]